ncbi:MAG: 4-(gamma-glutamylamino)butanal dehydrogenase, partial [Actinomycetota bacterium]|nr:4-(gamma-glutamylamino)butanal dehydrogenase [Actinomycetota bacterium]
MDNANEPALLDSLEMGKPADEARRVDVTKAAETIAWYAETTDKTHDEVAPTPGDAPAWITREPLGVIGVVPWNYALPITSWKLGPALATGNSVVVKPAEQTSPATLLLARLASEAGLPDGVLNAVPRAAARSSARPWDGTRTSTRSRSPARPRSRGCSRSTPGSRTASRSPSRRAASRRSWC